MDLSKRAHGMHWGWHQRVQDNWRIGLTSHGGAFVKLNNTDEITGEMLVKFGNDFGANWIDHKSIPHDNWYFWDNPEIPQLLNPWQGNPQAKKEFVRFTRGSLFTETVNSQPDSTRLENIIQDLSGGRDNLESLIRPIPMRLRKTRRVLICPSSPNCFTYYYGCERNSWIAQLLVWCEQNSWDPVVRNKPPRDARKNNQDSRLYDHLVLEDYAFTISQHSVAAVESIMAGVPAVVTGPHPIGDLATDLKRAESSDFELPDTDRVWRWIQRLASNTYHKTELFTGTWHK